MDRKNPDEHNWTINFRMPNGKNLTWVFNKNDHIRELYLYIALHSDLAKFKLSFGFPRKALLNTNESLLAVGFEGDEMVIVEKL
jgi:hypothetical protein